MQFKVVHQYVKSVKCYVNIAFKMSILFVLNNLTCYDQPGNSFFT